MLEDRPDGKERTWAHQSSWHFKEWHINLSITGLHSAKSYIEIVETLVSSEGVREVGSLSGVSCDSFVAGAAFGLWVLCDIRALLRTFLVVFQVTCCEEALSTADTSRLGLVACSVACKWSVAQVTPDMLNGTLDPLEPFLGLFA